MGIVVETITEYGDIAVEQSGGGQGMTIVRDVAAHETLSMFYDLTDALTCMGSIVHAQHGDDGVTEWLYQLNAAPGAGVHWEWAHANGGVLFYWVEGD